MSTAEDQTMPYPEQQELIGEPAAVAESPAVDPYTRDVMADRHRAGDAVADLADDYGYTVEQVQAAVEQAPEVDAEHELWLAQQAPGDDRLDLISANRAECAQCANYTAENEGGDQPCCDCRRESADKPSTHFRARGSEAKPPTKQERWAEAEPTDEECRAPRRRHRWDLLGGSFVVGDETSTIERLRCRRCGLQARRVPTRTGGSLRLEVLADEGSKWTPEISECPGEQEQPIDQRIAEKLDRLEHQVDQLLTEAAGLNKEIEIRGQLLDRVKVAMRETWWHGAVERVEQIKDLVQSDGSVHSLVAFWHRKAQSADHWETKYERQIKHSKRVEAERNQALDERDDLGVELATLREERRRIQWGSTALADEAEQELEKLRAELAALRAAPAPAPTLQRRVPPSERRSTIKRFEVAGTTCYLIAGHYAEGDLCELFIAAAKEGSTIRGLLDGWARLFSIALQHGVPLAHLVEKVKGTRFDPSGWTDDPEITPVASILDYVARWLERRYLPPPAGEQGQGVEP